MIINDYFTLILMYIGINIILATSLNLINGYMGEFSVGHAGFMLTGAYVSSALTVLLFPSNYLIFLFPVAIILGGLASALIGLIVAIPSFKTRGDYLAIVTFAFNMIVISAVQNMDALGGARGFMGMDRLTNLASVIVWTIICILVIRNFVYSKFGRGAEAIREDEIVADLMSVNTREVKIWAFVISSFFAGIAGGLLAHLIQYINPSMFGILKSTDILIMVYLGGVGSIMGSILGATIFTVLLEILRPLQMWRMVVMPLILVFLMLFLPRGIMSLKEFKWFIPKREKK